MRKLKWTLLAVLIVFVILYFLPAFVMEFPPLEPAQIEPKPGN